MLKMSVKQKSRNFRFGFSSVLKTGLEPVRPNGHWILSPTCLPIPPLQHIDYNCNQNWYIIKSIERKTGFEPATPTLAR